MGIILKSFIKAKGAFLKRSFDSLAEDPWASQKNHLFKILQENAATEYGKKYNFSTIVSESEFQKQVPITTYQDLEPFVERILEGRRNVLTAEMPFMFNVTSGTTGKPKYIPVNSLIKKRTARLMDQWLYRCLLDHPSFLDKYSLSITSSAMEGRVASGIPYGSSSGLIYRNLPRVMRGSYVLPFIIGDIKNYELRYYAMARLALEKDVSVAVTPNPTTLKKVAETGIKHQDEIIRSINAGRLFTNLKFELDQGDSEIVALINASLNKNPTRSHTLESTVQDKGELLPLYCWPSLKLIGCWLGGSVGYQAENLSMYYGDVPKRDIGHLASEGGITLPIEDNTPSGILALQNNYYEFISEESSSSPDPEVLRAHELEQGRYYKVILTNESGLYRYDINDTVKVDDFYKCTPVLSFIRKTNDVLNLTGEKLHVNQFIMAMEKISQKFSVPILQFRAVSNSADMRYDICLALGREVSAETLSSSVIPAIDSCLSGMNIEYEQKRKSGRLNPPCLHIMKPEWEESVKKKLVESGKRDIQYKWCFILPKFFDMDQQYIKFSVNHEG